MPSTSSPEFRSFLTYVGEAGYASEKPITRDLSDGSHDIVIEKDGWRFHDNWFGGEPFGGAEVISKDGKAFWMMTYFGAIKNPDEKPADVYAALKEAMRLPDQDMPVRGKRELTASNGYKYAFVWTGDLDRFNGNEKIYNKVGKIVYEAEVSGGLIDQ